MVVLLQADAAGGDVAGGGITAVVLPDIPTKARTGAALNGHAAIAIDLAGSSQLLRALHIGGIDAHAGGRLNIQLLAVDFNDFAIFQSNAGARLVINGHFTRI